MYDLTAAHPTLPLGSWVRVTNLRNGRAVVVRINDRGELSRTDHRSFLQRRPSAAIQSEGLQRVRLDVVRSKTAKDRAAAAGGISVALLACPSQIH